MVDVPNTGIFNDKPYTACTLSHSRDLHCHAPFCGNGTIVIGTEFNIDVPYSRLCSMVLGGHFNSDICRIAIYAVHISINRPR